MEIFKPTSLLILLLVSCGVFCAEAQKRPQRTSSARAYYGEAKLKPKLAKKKKQKATNYTHTRPAKGTRADAWTTRKKYQRS